MKRYIRAFALPRKDALDRLHSYSKEISEHIIKYVMFKCRRPESARHWMHEVAAYFSYCDRFNISSAKLKDKDYAETLFSCFSRNPKDAEDLLYQFEYDCIYRYKLKNVGESLPFFSITKSMGHDLHDCFSEIILETLPVLRDKGEHSVDQWMDLLISIVDSYVYDLQDYEIVDSIDEI